MTAEVIRYNPIFPAPPRYWSEPPLHCHTVTNPDGSWSYLGSHNHLYDKRLAASRYSPDVDCE